MLKTHHREKLLNAIILFASNTTKCGKTKLYKLLFLLDFDHFRATGRSVTGLDYYAWTMGPVPVELNGQLDEPSGDLFQAVSIVPEQVVDHQRLKVVPKREFDARFFSKRELHLLEEISGRYRDSTADEMIEVTHAENGAWEKVWREGEGRNGLIDYNLALDDVDDRQRIEKAAEEYREIVRRLGTA